MKCVGRTRASCVVGVGSVWVGLLVSVVVLAVAGVSAGETLKEARAGFRTGARATDYKPDPGAKASTLEAYRLVRYPSPAGELTAYVSADPGDGRKHPVVVWAHGGFGGVDVSELAPQPASNDQSPDAFRAAGFAVVYPSWRGENDNPGRFELFYGEVDDLMAAVAYAKSLPYVDPKRMYLMGHSSGGALVLLAVEMGVDVRAAFSFGGTPEIGTEIKGRKGAFYQYTQVPFDWQDERELRVRSPLNFVADIRVPTVYVEGDRVTSNVRGARAMMEAAAKAKGAGGAGVPLDVHLVAGADHFDGLRAIKRLVAGKLVKDTGEGPFAIKFGDEEIQQAYAAFKGAKPREVAESFTKLGPEVVQSWKKGIEASEAKYPGVPYFVRVGVDADGAFYAQVQHTYDVGDVQCEVQGVRVVMDPAAYAAMAPFSFEIREVDGKKRPVIRRHVSP